jgi:hypothetical protein
MRHDTEGIPSSVKKIPDDTIQAAFARHVGEIATRQTREQNQVSAEAETHQPECDASDRVPVSFEVMHPSEYAFDASSPGLKYTPRKLCYKSISSSSFLVGKLEIITDGALIRPALRNVHATIVLRLKPWLLNINLMLQKGSTFLKPADPLLNCRSLRVFYTITDHDAPILKAIESSDYRWFRELMQTRRATPFDIIDWPNHVDFTLFQYLLGCGKENVQVPNMAYLLAESGGVTYGDGGFSVYQFADSRSRSDDSKIDTALLEIIIRHSASNPCSDLSSLVSQGQPETVSKSIPKILSQDEWDTEECKPAIEEEFGPGSWDFLCLKANAYSDWRNQQELCWWGLCKEIGRSRGHCRRLFGTWFLVDLFDELILVR